MKSLDAGYQDRHESNQLALHRSPSMQSAGDMRGQTHIWVHDTKPDAAGLVIFNHSCLSSAHRHDTNGHAATRPMQPAARCFIAIKHEDFFELFESLGAISCEVESGTSKVDSAIFRKESDRQRSDSARALNQLKSQAIEASRD